MINDVERRTRLALLRVSQSLLLAWNWGIRVVLLLFLLKNILQKIQPGKTVKECSRISLSVTTVRLAQTRTPQMSPMKKNSNDFTSCKTQTGKRSIYFLWQVLFTTRNLDQFFKRINEFKMTTKFSRLDLGDGIVMCIFVRSYPQYQCVK